MVRNLTRGCRQLLDSAFDVVVSSNGAESAAGDSGVASGGDGAFKNLINL